MGLMGDTVWVFGTASHDIGHLSYGPLGKHMLYLRLSEGRCYSKGLHNQ